VLSGVHEDPLVTGAFERLQHGSDLHEVRPGACNYENFHAVSDEMDEGMRKLADREWRGDATGVVLMARVA
jgi:hypothetical protein